MNKILIAVSMLSVTNTIAEQLESIGTPEDARASWYLDEVQACRSGVYPIASVSDCMIAITAMDKVLENIGYFDEKGRGIPSSEVGKEPLNNNMPSINTLDIKERSTHTGFLVGDSHGNFINSINLNKTTIRIDMKDINSASVGNDNESAVKIGSVE